MSTYTHRPWRVAAIQWTGSNFPDVERFLVEHLGEDCGPRNDYDPDDEFDYNTVQFYAGDDQEVDPERWIVVYLGVDDDQVEIMHADDFRAAYELVSGDAR